MAKAENATLLGTRLINEYSKIARQVAWIERSEIRVRRCRRTIIPGFRWRSIRLRSLLKKPTPSWHGAGERLMITDKSLAIILGTDTIQHLENRRSDAVGIPVRHRVCRPSDEVLANGPYLGDFFEALTRDGGFLYHHWEKRTEYVHIELTENERRDLRIGPWKTVSGDLWDVFFAGDGH
jgi:hypothetical protein